MCQNKVKQFSQSVANDKVINFFKQLISCMENEKDTLTEDINISSEFVNGYEEALNEIIQVKNGLIQIQKENEE